MEQIQLEWNHMPKSDDSEVKLISLEEVAKARTFHQTFP